MIAEQTGVVGRNNRTGLEFIIEGAAIVCLDNGLVSRLDFGQAAEVVDTGMGVNECSARTVVGFGSNYTVLGIVQAERPAFGGRVIIAGDNVQIDIDARDSDVYRRAANQRLAAVWPAVRQYL